MKPQKNQNMGPYYDIACELARGFFCGNTDDKACKEWNCVTDGCASLRDGIYEELNAAAESVVEPIRGKK